MYDIVLLLQDPSAWVALATLVVMEVVLGIDNLVFVAILTNTLPDRYQIPADHLGSHDEFADGPTACPGKNFPSQAIFGSKHVAAR